MPWSRYSQLAGLTQAPGTFGFAHVVFSPPASIIGMAAANVTLNANLSQPLWLASVSKRTQRGTFSMHWALPPTPPSVVTTCAVHGYPMSGALMYLGCPNPLLNKIQAVRYAVIGSPPANSSSATHASAVGNTDRCTNLFRSQQNSSGHYGCGFDLSAVVARACVGQGRCHVQCNVPSDGYKNCRVNGQFVNTSHPAHAPRCTGGTGVLGVQVECPAPLRRGTVLVIDVVVPPNSRATTRVPLLGARPQD
eukprot:COSAG01_NODE_12505_length_1728_cov_1.237569_1_plen_249_part_10